MRSAYVKISMIAKAGQNAERKQRRKSNEAATVNSGRLDLSGDRRHHRRGDRKLFRPGVRCHGKDQFCRRRDADLRRALFRLPPARWTGKREERARSEFL